MAAKNVTAATFQDDVLSSANPVLVDFWAEWCGPCRMVSPILDEIAGEHGDKITIVKVNVDEEPGLAQQYGITSIPAMQVFQNGEVVKSIIGAKPKPVLLADLSAFIN
jgi:thioredoxin 1